jgi:hypothetical protein
MHVSLTAEAEIRCVQQFTHLLSAMCDVSGVVRLSQSLLLLPVQQVSNLKCVKCRRKVGLTATI